MAVPPFTYQDPFPLSADETDYRLLSREGISTATFEGREILQVEPGGAGLLAQQAFHDCSFMLRPKHLQQVAAILDDPEASENDRYVALTLLKNAEIAAQGIAAVLPGHRHRHHHGQKRPAGLDRGGDDAEWLAAAFLDCYTKENLRYSQTAPLDMWNEVNTGTNLPAQLDLYATEGAKYEFLFVAKGGGSANKTFLFQETKALLNPKSLEKFIVDKMGYLGTAACPPYHLTFVIGGTSAETCLKTVKLASTKYLDTLPTTGNAHGRAFRDVALEQKVLTLAQQTGIGAQFGGKYFALDVRIIRLPRHGASCPVGHGRLLQRRPQHQGQDHARRHFPRAVGNQPRPLSSPRPSAPSSPANAVRIDLNQPMPAILAELSRHPVTTRVLLSGPMIVARDIAHAKLKERIDAGQACLSIFKQHPVYYAGPAKTPQGYASGSFGPTTAGRMDSYVDQFQSLGGSMIMLAKGNRSPQVTQACKKYGGFYLGSIGGPAAILAKENIKKVEVLEYPEFGMEAVWKIEVEDFPRSSSWTTRATISSSTAAAPACRQRSKPRLSPSPS
jgi:fumarate hydratase class I